MIKESTEIFYGIDTVMNTVLQFLYHTKGKIDACVDYTRPSLAIDIIILKRAFLDARKRGDVPPFFVVVEEAQNFIPERNFGEAKSSKIIRQIASESRKFGIGLCLITQRPSRIVLLWEME